MKSIYVLFLFCISLLIAGCGKDPGPIPANMSRIKVECRGLGSGGYVYITVAGVQPEQIAQPGGEINNYGCFFYGDQYFDVTVPPLSFYANFKSSMKQADPVTRSDLVTFTGAGEQVVLKTSGFFLKDDLLTSSF